MPKAAKDLLKGLESDEEVIVIEEKPKKPKKKKGEKSKYDRGYYKVTCLKKRFCFFIDLKKF